MGRTAVNTWANVIEILRARSRKAGECIEWTGYANQRGYGQIEIDGKLWLAHRLVWTIANGAIPDGKLVLHQCDNPRCVKAAHLVLGTHKDNSRHMIERGRFDARKLWDGSRKLRKVTPAMLTEFKTSAESTTELARRLGVHRSTIYRTR